MLFILEFIGGSIWFVLLLGFSEVYTKPFAMKLVKSFEKPLLDLATKAAMLTAIDDKLLEGWNYAQAVGTTLSTFQIFEKPDIEKATKEISEVFDIEVFTSKLNEVRY